MSAPWIFEQRGGDRKKFTLANDDAPHGRARQNPVVRDGLAVRKSRTLYPGNDEPTTHLFGRKSNDMELVGRFMDSYGGKGYAAKMTDMVKSFVDDQQPVRITWGNLVCVDGFIDEFDPGRESAGNVQWKMKITVDDDLMLAASKAGQTPEPQKPQDFSKKIASALSDALGTSRTGESLQSFPPSLDLGLGEFLDSLVTLVNTPAALMLDVANSLQSLESSTIGSLNRLRAGIHQTKTAVLRLEATYADAQTNVSPGQPAAVTTSRADDKQRFGGQQAHTAVAMNKTSAALRKLDRAVAIAIRGKIKSLYVARAGDTWEGIATAQMGSAVRSAELQQANGETGKPRASVRYVIPR